jgi:DNA-binding beta-propeller fold protein YncE
VEGLDDADNVRFDSKARRVYVGYGDGALAVIDPSNWKKSGGVKLSGHPESFQLDPAGQNIYVNVPDAKKIETVERTQGKVITTWPMSEFQANFPMALDATNHRIFIGCRKPAQVVVFDTSSGKKVANVPISGDTDDLFYDAKSGRVYISCGEGFINVIARQGQDEYKLVSKIPTRAGARTSFFSGARGEFYLLLPETRNSPAELRVYKVQE